MYTINSKAVIGAINSNTRTFRAYLDMGGYTISGSAVCGFTTEHRFTEEGLQIGGVISQRAEITLTGSRLPRKDDRFTLYLYLVDWDTPPGSDPSIPTAHRDLAAYAHRELAAYTFGQVAHLGRIRDFCPVDGVVIPMGRFTAVSVKTKGCLATVIAYDRLNFTDIPYVPSISFPASSDAVLEDILARIGIDSQTEGDDGNLRTQSGENVLDSTGQEVLCSERFTFTFTKAPAGTCREILGHIAAMYGGNAACGRNGEFSILFFRNGWVHFEAPVHLDEPELTEGTASISGIRCQVDEENVLTYGDTDGLNVLEFACPYMTSERLEQISRVLRSWKWTPAQIQERLGDPRRELGDGKALYVGEKQYRIPITSLTFTFDGGLSADIESSGDTGETEV